MAVWQKNKSITKLLLQYNASPDLTNNENKVSPLELSKLNDDKYFYKLMLYYKKEIRK